MFSAWIDLLKLSVGFIIEYSEALFAREALYQLNWFSTRLYIREGVINERGVISKNLRYSECFHAVPVFLFVM